MATLLLSLWASSVHAGAPVPALPGGSTLGDKTLAQWQEIYWRWFYGDLAVSTDANGNPVVGSVVLMPFPLTPGDGTAGSINVSLASGQPFMLPLWNILGNAYSDGSFDPFLPLALYQTLDIKFTIDGVTVVDSRNAMNYFTQVTFDPPIPFDYPPAVSFTYIQGIAITHAPLTAGKHVMKMDAKNTDTADFFGITIEYHNTWNLTVQPGR